MTVSSNPPRSKWPKRAKPERENIYAAVRSLRERGHEVARDGLHHHAVDGVRVSPARLVWIAQKAARRAGP